MSQSIIEQSKQRSLSQCKHFNGLLNDRCRIGLSYSDLPRPLPCHVKNQKACACPGFELMSEEEAEAMAIADEARISEFLRTLKKGTNCPHCGEAIASRELIGRCTYVRPCGHRLGQTLIYDED